MATYDRCCRFRHGPIRLQLLHNSSVALIKCQHSWLKWLDNDAQYVTVFLFDFKKAFDPVPHDMLCKKNVEIAYIV